MAIVEERLRLLDDLVLDVGYHHDWESGASVMEAVSYLAGEPFSSHPDCASPVIGTFLRSWGDDLNNKDRQTLKQYVPRLIGSKGTPEQEDTREWMVLDWLVRTYTPTWLRFAGLSDKADRLSGLPKFEAGVDVAQVMPTLTAVRADADVARGPAWTTSAHERAFLASAGSAAWVATRTASLDATHLAVSRATAGNTAWAAAWDAAPVATRDATPAKARAALRPTVKRLHASAHDLVDRMLNVTETSDNEARA